MFTPRPKQQAVIEFDGGKMGVSAVPGSGKTRTLSYLAAKLIASGKLEDDQEVLIVTLVNSAVDNFSRQVSDFVQQQGLLPNYGYRVRTLHGLANDIVRERPSLVGLDEKFEIIDERTAQDIVQDAVSGWVRANREHFNTIISTELQENEINRVFARDWERDVQQIALGFIKQAKDLELEPETIRSRLDMVGEHLPLAEMGWEIYTAYQRGLRYRGGVDFQDLIRLALRALRLDSLYLERLRNRWKYILEDEAQDSSELQETMLRLLVGPKGNWVRVGDPNQAIYETFTTASPEFLRNFIAEKGVKSRELPNSGRSTKSIIKLANFLTDWSLKRHPSVMIRDKLRPLTPPLIEPVPRGDPQPNPKDKPDQIYIRMESYTAAQEIENVVTSVKRWLISHPDKTVAVLVPRNDRGVEYVEAFKKASVEVVELLRSTSSARQIAGAVALVLSHLAMPTNPQTLAKSFEVWQRDSRGDQGTAVRLREISRVLRQNAHVEEFIHPRAGQDALDTHPKMVELIDSDPAARNLLLEFREVLRRWEAAIVLPIDQLVLTLAQDLFRDPLDLAVAYSIAISLRREADNHPLWQIDAFADELGAAARNKRTSIFLADREEGFDPDAHKGKVTIATMHRAKGLEWDRVYLTSVNNYDFPSDEPHDTYISEKWYVRDKLNLEAEARAQLKRLVGGIDTYVEGEATRRSRLEYVSERLRLLYVGITRARQELVITWNTGRNGDLVAAAPLVALSNFWDKNGR